MKCARFAPLAALLATALVLVASPDRATTEENAARSKPTVNATDRNTPPTEREQIEQVLSRPVRLEFSDVALRDAIDYIRNREKVEIQIYEKVLSDAGIDSSTLPITVQSDGIALRSALNLMLKPQGLTSFVKDEVLAITTKEEADSELKTCVYDVLDLIGDQTEDGLNFDPLIDLITSVIASQTWSELGGPGSIVGFRASLTVSQTRDVHEEIVGLLSALRDAHQNQQAGQPAKCLTIGPGKVLTPKLEKLMALKTSLKYDAEPFSNVLADFYDRTGINFHLDSKVLSDAGIDPSTLPISIDVKDVSVRAAIALLLSPQGLTWYYCDETPIITTKEAADTELTVAVYPVADLVGPNSQTDAEKKLRLAAATADSLIDLITSTIATQTWSDLGGPGSLKSFDDDLPVLIVAQTREVHDEIAALLADVRKSGKSQQNALANLAAAPIKPASMILRVYLLKPNSPDSPAIPPNELAPLIQSLTEPKSWQIEQAFVQGMPGRLIVRQTRRVHREIAKVLNELGVVPAQSQIGAFGCGCF